MELGTSPAPLLQESILGYFSERVYGSFPKQGFPVSTPNRIESPLKGTLPPPPPPPQKKKKKERAKKLHYFRNPPPNRVVNLFPKKYMLQITVMDSSALLYAASLPRGLSECGFQTMPTQHAHKKTSGVPCRGFQDRRFRV